MGEKIAYLADSHCHLSADFDEANLYPLINQINKKWAHNIDKFQLHLMTTNHIDLWYIDSLVEEVEGEKIVPYFGIHPWYSHLFSFKDLESYEDKSSYKIAHYQSVLDPPAPNSLLEVLPDPIYIVDYLAKMKNIIQKRKCLNAKVGIGEIGLDKLFRVPNSGYFGNRNYKSNGDATLSKSKVTLNHQKKIYEELLMLASSYRLPVSLHCVKAQGTLLDTTLDPKFQDIPCVTLHSFTGSSDQIRLWRKLLLARNQKFFVSLSNVINGSEQKLSNLESIINNVDETNILIETDFPIDKFFFEEGGYQSYYENIESILNKVCMFKKWDKRKGQETVYRNWNESIMNNH